MSDVESEGGRHTRDRGVSAWVAVFVGIFLFAACNQGGTIAVRPFSDVQATEFVFEADPTNTNRGIFRVETTEPMICAIVWGETEELGNFNNSLAMNGTGIVEHDVFLPGAEPGVEYFFQVQGSTADGTLYQSELATFVLPEGASGPPTTQGSTLVNLAESGTVDEVSSEFSSAWAGGNAIDGDLGTEWSTSGDGDEAWIVVDLGATHEIGGFEFITRSMADGTAITTEYQVTVDDGEALGPFPAGTPVDAQTSVVAVTGRRFRFDVTSTTGGNTGAIEIRIFAATEN